jgi:hypothetical protein
MIQPRASFEMNFEPVCGWGDLLEQNSSKERLFKVIQKLLEKHAIKSSINEQRLELDNGLILFRPEDYYWVIVDNSDDTRHCLGIFRDESSAADSLVSTLIRPLAYAVNWDEYLNDCNFIKTVRKTLPLSSYIIEKLGYNFNPPGWFKIETDYPPTFFKSNNDIFDRFGYLLGKKLIFEIIKSHLKKIKDKLKLSEELSWLLDDMGYDEEKLSLSEASGYWIASIAERGVRNFQAIFTSYKSAVDFFIYTLCKRSQIESIDWGLVFNHEPL